MRDPEVTRLADIEGHETVQMSKTGDQLVSKTRTDDYRYHPLEHEVVNLYEWIQCLTKHDEQNTRLALQSLEFFPYHPAHPQHLTHTVACDPDH